MSITIEVDETLLRAAEDATNIHDPNALVREALAKLSAQTPPNRAPFDSDAMMASLPPCTKEEDNHWEDFERDREWERETVPKAGTATLAELLACAAALPDLSEPDFAAWERELANPTPMRDPWKS